VSDAVSYNTKAAQSPEERNDEQWSILKCRSATRSIYRSPSLRSFVVCSLRSQHFKESLWLPPRGVRWYTDFGVDCDTSHGGTASFHRLFARTPKIDTSRTKIQTTVTRPCGAPTGCSKGPRGPYGCSNSSLAERPNEIPTTEREALHSNMPCGCPCGCSNSSLASLAR